MIRSRESRATSPRLMVPDEGIAMFLDNLRTSICGRRGVCKAASMANNCSSAR